MSAATDYHFVTTWRVAATCGEVADVLGDPATLPRWWPAVYLRVDEIAPADASGLGRRLRLLTRGWLPYTLQWELVVIDSRYPHGFALDASGDFVGRGIWTFEQEGPVVVATYDWQVTVEKVLLRTLSPLLKPIFAANHRWAMARGEESLRLELLRRRATSDRARMAVSRPPGPAAHAGLTVAAAAAVIGGTLAYLLRRSRRARRAR